jgi:hypothetical protein
MELKTRETAISDQMVEEGFAPFIEVNDIACKRYGYTREEFLKLTARDITRKTESDKHANSKFRKVLLHRKHLFLEAVHVKKSGTIYVRLYR